MHCASCASIIEKMFKKTDGVHSAEVNYATETTKISFDPTKTSPESLSKNIEKLGYSLHIPTADDMHMSASEHAEHLGLNQSKQEKLVEIRQMRNKVLSALPLASFSIIFMVWDVLIKYNVAPEMNTGIEKAFYYLLPLAATYMLFIVGKPYLLGFYRFLRYGKANMDTLIGIGTLSAYIYSLVITIFDVLKIAQIPLW